MLRGDFHHHIDSDPVDGSFVRHSMGELIDRAVDVGLNVLAVTCHEAVPYEDSAIRYAADRGVLLLRGMEATAQGHHVLLINFREFPSGVCTMDDIARCKDRDALVIAPHPFYPTGVAGGSMLRAHRDLLDAVEFSGMYTALTPHFNRRAERFARESALPVVGNSDTHFIWQPGRTFTWIDAPPERSAVLDAIRHGRVRLETRPLGWRQVMQFVHESQSAVNVVRDATKYLQKVLRRTRRAERELAAAAIDREVV